jgi:hypothetical protein
MILQNNPMQCGAKTRDGSPCASPSMPNGRCRMHGGSSKGAPAGNDNAVKHGIYRSTLSAEECADYDNVEIGGLDAELRLARVRLARALKSERDSPDPGCDYPAIVDRLLARIAGLEVARKKIAGPSDDDEVLLIDPDSDIP